MEYKQVLVVRKDLKLTKGKLAVQVAHASVSCVEKMRRKYSSDYKTWLLLGQKKVVLVVEDLATLEKLERRAKEAKLLTVKIQDAGLTQLPPGTVTVLGIGPHPANKLDPVTGSLKLL